MAPISPKNSRNFKPMKISDSLNNFNKKMLYKFGELDYIINAKWEEIVGTFFVNHSEPNKITSIPSSTHNVEDIIYEKFLHVNVTPSAAIEFQHFQNKILDKINSYFGYKAITGIKIHQNFLNKEKIETKKNKVNIYKKEKHIKELQKTTSKIISKDLKESVVKLGLSIEENSE